MIDRHPGRLEVWSEDEVGRLAADQGRTRMRELLAESGSAEEGIEPMAPTARHTGKYRALAGWLAGNPNRTVDMTFSEIEEILGFPLPPSCRNHAASAATMTLRFGNRSATAPASGASKSTGRISKATVPATRRPEPVIWKTRMMIATALNVSPHLEMVCAANRRRKAASAKGPRRCASLKCGPQPPDSGVTIHTSLPAGTTVSRPSRKRTFSSPRNTLTPGRSVPGPE